jgi:hypothetical protein
VGRRVRKVKETWEKQERRERYILQPTNILKNLFKWNWEEGEDTFLNTTEELPSPTWSLWLYWSQFIVYVLQERLENESEKVRGVRGVGVEERSGKGVEREREKKWKREGERERKSGRGMWDENAMKKCMRKVRRKCKEKMQDELTMRKLWGENKRKWERKCKEKMRKWWKKGIKSTVI